MEKGNNFKWILYCTYCTVNKKIYLGVHKTDTPYEFDEMIGEGVKVGFVINNPHNNAFLNALKKYGYSKFIRFTIKVFDTEEKALEAYKLLVDEDFIKDSNNYNYCLPGKKIEKYYQYDSDGNFIKKWNSRAELLKNFEIDDDQERIDRAIKSHRSAFGSFWSDHYEKKLDVSTYGAGLSNVAYKFTRDGEFVCKYDDLKQCAEENKIPFKALRQNILKKKPCGEFFYLKNPNMIHDVINIYHDNDDRNDTISCYDIDTLQLVQTFPNKKFINNTYGVSYKEIKRAIAFKEPMIDYYWAYGWEKEFNKNKKLKI